MYYKFQHLRPPSHEKFEDFLPFSEPINCPMGWQGLDDKCYMKVDKKLSLAKAVTNCIRNGGKLMEPYNEKTHELAKKRARHFFGKN